MAGKTVRRFLDGLGYAVHTPASVFGKERLDQHVYDEDWLPIVGSNGWVVSVEISTSWIGSLS